MGVIFDSKRACLLRLLFSAGFLLASSLLRSEAVAQQRFPLPQQTDQRVKAEAGISIGLEKGAEQKTKARIKKFAELKAAFPPHELGCPTNYSSTDYWKTDATLTVNGGLGSSGLGSGGLAQQDGYEKFMGCFEPTARPDFPVKAVPFPILGTPFNLVVDPVAGNCCPTDSELLSKGALKMGFFKKILFLLRYPMLFPFFDESRGCNLSEDKSNVGFHLDFWWPENEVELHNYERTIFDPLIECGNTEFKSINLGSNLRAMAAYLKPAKPAESQGTPMVRNYETAGIWPELRNEPHLGNSSWGGMLPGDQTYTSEAHVFRTYLNTLTAINEGGQETFLGYKRDCRCFGSGLPSQKTEDGKERKIVNGWTEQPKFAPFWRWYQLSRNLNDKTYEAIKDFQMFGTDTCASLRAYDSRFATDPFRGGPTGYSDLIKAVGIGKPNAEMTAKLKRICYLGGGDLFPITGQLIGHFSPLPASAYLGRRALYLFGKDEIEGDREFVPPERRINKYSDKNDKMQRVYPLKDELRVSKCFRTHEIPNYLQEGRDRENWPRDVVTDALDIGKGGPNDSPRYNYWNKRQSCMCPYLGQVWGLQVAATGQYIACIQTGNACRLKEEGDVDDTEKNPTGALEGWSTGHRPPRDMPDGIPYPFLPDNIAASYGLDPIKGSDPAWPQSIGNDGQVCELKPGPGKMYTRLPEETEPRGLRCGKYDPRCIPPLEPLRRPPVAPR